MKIEKQVASKQDALELQKLGIDFGDTAFVWIKYKSSHNENIRHILMLNEDDLQTSFSKNVVCVFDKCKILETIPAPTVPEMIDRLPCTIEKDGVELHLTIIKITGDYFIDYTNNSEGGCSWLFDDDDAMSDKLLSKALTKLLIWCAEEGYL